MNTGDSNILFFHALKEKSVVRMRRFLVIIFFVLTAMALQNCDEHRSRNSSEDDFFGHTLDTTFAHAVTIAYSDSSISVINPFDTLGVTISIDGGDVVVNSTITGTEIQYVLSGKISDGMFKIYSVYKLALVFNGVSITNDNGPAVNVQSSKKVSVNIVYGTNNRLIDGASYITTSEDQKATLFSEGQLSFSGTGSLKVKGNYKHGIAGDDYIYIKESNIDIIAAASDGVHANDYFTMESGYLHVVASGDGIECEEGFIAILGGHITVNSIDEGITASYEDGDISVTPYIQITGGTIHVTTSGAKAHAIKSESHTTINSGETIMLTVLGPGAKGIKTGGNLTLINNSITITTGGNAYYDASASDIVSSAGIDCDGYFLMEQGTLTVTSSGTAGKGINIDSTMEMNNGTISVSTTGAGYIYGSLTSEAKAIKCDGAITINDGTIMVSSADDGIKSETALTINGGTVTVTKSYEGLEAPLVTMNNGNVSVTASDDAVNTTYGNGGEAVDGSLLTFAGGTIALNSSNGDAIDANGNIEMTGGVVIAQGPKVYPEVAIDCNGNFNISGGLLIASGPNAGPMIEATSTTSTQYTALIKIISNVSPGRLFNIQDSEGNSLVTYAPSRVAYYFVFSSPLLQNGATYKVFTGGNCTGATVTNGLYFGGTYSGGTQKGSFTISSKVTTATL